MYYITATSIGFLNFFKSYDRDSDTLVYTSTNIEEAVKFNTKQDAEFCLLGLPRHKARAINESDLVEVIRPSGLRRWTDVRITESR